ncbi:2-C-methyl-D-erythritol 2,4-cyclodiphosphate synthase [Chlamydia pneumoniae]|nr:2-C-methyl-D-erythritol 2,4-cyclodiphosphate synthase [Chlamydia pneumoniae]CRI35921.1 2-C-methyl-D-erythritol 2,4-cyclodiphosphate synthase [Chlamydia pneumoniae]CRI37048.1 2-C-methyl-D-erythritol 2,4-cyclodiphosphate synthase [Chlamydia pneumoniae]CRI38175.1 2-C-methyl-D-erythritol 2,4-cyclodiphosphate synthase [Chlamydia pneumoniae]CRI39307.1 2-C-methyl-D-erythritol 2,4-cyclodiphosphate synthase [Chlamydia pneumoniae]
MNFRNFVVSSVKEILKKNIYQVVMDRDNEVPLPKPKWIYRTGIGQDSHRFLPESSTKPCILGGIIFDHCPGFQANSDGDIIFHAICNAISSVTNKIILGKVADELLQTRGITDSGIYLEEALKSLKPNQKISHVAITIEGSRPKFLCKLSALRQNIAQVMNLTPTDIGITATSGEGLSDFGCGDGVQCFCVLTVMEYCD